MLRPFTAPTGSSGGAHRCGVGWQHSRPKRSPRSSSSPTGRTSSPAAIDRVVDVWRESGAEIVAATYGGDRGHPVLLARPVWERVPDQGARTLPALLVPCDDLGSPGDVDSADDLPERFKPPPAE